MKTETFQAPAETSRAVSSGARDVSWRGLVPVALALLFALWSLRGVSAGNVVDTDAARHAMNGVFLHDWLRSGLPNPLEYARYYYSRLPALSLPYHPPLFPAVEAVFFLVFGVDLLAARLAVTLATAASVMLFYGLVRKTHSSMSLAVFSTVAFFGASLTRPLFSDVMLELPALVFTLGALHCVVDLERFTWRRSLAFALLAGAALWTKQQTVFLAAVPLACALLSRRWRLLVSARAWAPMVLVFLSGLLLSFPSRYAGGAGLNQVPPPREVLQVFRHNSLYYLQALRDDLGLLPLLFLAVSVAASLLWRRQRREGLAANDLYIAWAAAQILLLLLIGPYSSRYLFFAYPALAVVGIHAVQRFFAARVPLAPAWLPPAGVAAVMIVLGWNTPVTAMTGPDQVAHEVLRAGAGRVLYCGHTDGSFIFALRVRQAELNTIVVRGDKLPPSAFEPERLERFARRFGIQYIVLERSRIAAPWDRLRLSPAPSMVFERHIPLVNSQRTWNGDLRLYRFTSPSPHPEDAGKIATAPGDSDPEAKL